MPIDHEEINERIDKLKYETSITLQQQLINEAQNKKNPDARLIESLGIKKIDFVQKLSTVQDSIRQRQQNRKR